MSAEVLLVTLGLLLGLSLYGFWLAECERACLAGELRAATVLADLAGEHRDTLRADLALSEYEASNLRLDLRHAQALAHLYAEERDDALDCNQHLFDALQAERARNAPVPAPLPTWKEA